MQRIFLREECSSSSSILNLPIDKRTKRRLCGESSSKNIQTNAQNSNSEREADKKVYSEMGVRKTQPNQDKEASSAVKSIPPFQSFLSKAHSKKPVSKKNSVHTQVCKENEENNELIRFSPRQTSQHKDNKRDLCGLQEKVNESSDLGASCK